MSNFDEGVLIIQGVREDGGKLRPSDWIERISSTLASFGDDQRLRYSDSVQPCVVNGEKCLIVARGLSNTEPAMYRYVVEFAESNRLRVLTDRRSGERALKT